MKVLIVGLGSIAQKHISAITEISADTEIYALRRQPDAQPVKSVTNVFSLDDLNFVPDFAIVSSPTSKHFEAIKMLMRFGCPLFIEKPAFDCLEGVDELLAEIEERNIVTYTACNLRFHDCLVYLKNYLSENRSFINEVNSYCGSYLPNWRPNSDFRTVYSANREMGGGVHLDLIHEVDYIYWLFGTPRKVNAVLKNKSSLKISAVDYANYALEYETFVAGIILNYYRTDSKRSCELVFYDKTWLVDIIKNTITENNRIVFSSPKTILDTYSEQMRYFIGCIESKRQPMNSLSEAVEVLRISLSE